MLIYVQVRLLSTSVDFFRAATLAGMANLNAGGAHTYPRRWCTYKPMHVVHRRTYVDT